MGASTELTVSRALAAYKSANAELLNHDPEFARWLESEYRPIAGGWMY